MNNSYTFSFTVAENQLDTLNHVNNINYIKWVQTAAEKHWSKISNSVVDSKFVWVVVRHEIDYLVSAKLNDEIEVKTWIGDTYGVKSERYVEIKRGNLILAKAKTIWCLLDKKTMKVVRIPSEILQILSKNKG
jgi:acyl-CoA thioester hydrolase